MAEAEVVCEVCSRKPAKHLSFEAHKGFVIFRKSFVLAGKFCRDHALEAYAHARGETLKGMWFSPGSLILGALSHLVDSAKLLGLPDEVRDAPWVTHKVACPHCSKGVWLPAGPMDCPECDRTFTIASCARCNLVHVSPLETYETLAITCRSCEHQSAAPRPVRNWRMLIFAKSICEVAAAVATSDSHLTQAKKHAFVAAIRALFTFGQRTWDYLDGYFYHCCKGVSDKLFEVSREFLEVRGIATLLGVAQAVSKADGIPSPSARHVIRTIAASLGIDPIVADPEPVRSAHGTEKGEGEGWWTILRVSRTASADEIRSSFRKLAAQLHPDTLRGIPEELRLAAAERLKIISAAYEEGLKRSN